MEDKEQEKVNPKDYLDKFRDKRPVKYSCLIASVEIDRHYYRYLEQHMDTIDNFLETWNKYD